MSVKGIKENKCLEEIKIDFEALKSEIMSATLELAFPIGKEYVTQEDINPATILGFGTWERLKGKVLVGLDESDEYFNTIGKEGGETTHTLTKNELPNYNLEITGVTDGGAIYRSKNEASNLGLVSGGVMADRPIVSTGTSGGSARYVAKSGGGDSPMNNTQPYKVVGYMWIRTA